MKKIVSTRDVGETAVAAGVLAKVRYPRKGEQYPGLSASQAQLPPVQLKGHIAALSDLLQPMSARRNAPCRSALRIPGVDDR